MNSTIPPAWLVTSGNGGVLAWWADFDGSGTFEAGERFEANVTPGINQLSFFIPATAVGAPGLTNPDGTFVRFRLGSPAAAAAGELNDPTGLARDGEVEDYAVLLNPPPALTVSIADAEISEGDGAAATTATVTRNTDTSSPLTVTLVSSDTTEALVVGTVTIAAGQNSATVDIDAVNDAIIDGTQTVTITASASGYSDGTDVVDVTDDDSEALTLTITQESVSEFGGIATATVTRNTATTGPLIVDLMSNDIGEATVPLTITIPAGQSSETFEITAVDDAIVDGNQTVTVTATSTGFQSATDTLVIADNDLPELTLTIAPNTISENGGTTTGTVTRNTGTSGALTVNLSSDDTGEAIVPTTVTIADGSDSATFTITGVPDGVVDNDQLIVIVAAADNFTQGSDKVVVANEDVATLSVVIASASITEEDGQAATTATVTRNTDTSSPLTVTLNSSDTTEATVPTTVTIPAGAATHSFDIDAVDDSIADGTQAVTVTASATGFASGVDTLDVEDVNEAPVLEDLTLSVAENSPARNRSCHEHRG